jgi:WD40 repeat protein
MESMGHSTIFICYASTNAVSCERYSSVLREQGFDIWYEQADHVDNSLLFTSIERKLKVCSALVVLLSPAAIRSRSVNQQLEAYRKFLARDPTKILLYVRIEPCQVPVLWGIYPLIEAFQQPFDETLSTLSEMLRGMKLSLPLSSPQPSRRIILGLLGSAVIGGSICTWWQMTRSVQAPHYQWPGTTFLIYRGHTSVVHTVAWSPDGVSIASGSDDSSVRVWNAMTGDHAEVYVLQALDEVHRTSVDWSSDNRYFASSSESTSAQVWDVQTQDHLFAYTGHTDTIYKVRWSPIVKRVASASKDGTVRVWDAFNGDHVLVYRGHSGIVWGVAWSPDGTKIASAGSDGVHVWNAANGILLLRYHGHTGVVPAISWSHDGLHIVTGGVDKSIQVWNAATGARLHTFSGHSDVVYGVAWSPDNRHIASASFDKTAQIWDTTTGKHVFAYHGHTDSVYEVTWAPDGTRIASCSDDETVRVWQAL